MSLDEILILLLALIAGLLLFVGLALALEGRPRPVHARRSPHLPSARRSFSAEERVLEHRARGTRTGVSPFATPPRSPTRRRSPSRSNPASSPCPPRPTLSRPSPSRWPRRSTRRP